MGYEKLVVQMSLWRKERLRAIAELTGATMSQVVRDLIDIGYELYKDRGEILISGEIQELKVQDCYAFLLRMIFGDCAVKCIREAQGVIDDVLASASNSNSLGIRLLRCRIGLDDGIRKTFEEVAEALETLTKEDVRQIEARTLRQIRHPRFGGRLRGFID